MFSINFEVINFLQKASKFLVSPENLFRIGLFCGCSWIGGANSGLLPKICLAYSTMMKLGTSVHYLEKIQKTCNSRDTLLEFC